MCKVTKDWLTACVRITVRPHEMRAYHMYYGVTFQWIQIYTNERSHVSSVKQQTITVLYGKDIG